MSATGRRTHRQLARRVNRVPSGYLDPRTGELTEAGEAWAEDLRDFDERDMEAEWFWRQESTRFYAPGLRTNPDTGVIG